MCVFSSPRRSQSVTAEPNGDAPSALISYTLQELQIHVALNAALDFATAHGRLPEVPSNVA